MSAPTSALTITAKLVAVTPEATGALGGRGTVQITQWPFKVGRESRSAASVHPRFTELRLGIAPELNDVYLIEPPWRDMLQISREHFAIDRVDDTFVLIDRGSVCGTIVAGKQIGGDRSGGQTELRNGDEIVVGSIGSEYVFRFEVTPAN